MILNGFLYFAMKNLYKEGSDISKRPMDGQASLKSLSVSFLKKLMKKGLCTLRPQKKKRKEKNIMEGKNHHFCQVCFVGPNFVRYEYRYGWWTIVFEL